jgi:hypothetical protein
MKTEKKTCSQSHKGKVELDVVTSSLLHMLHGTWQISVGIKPSQRGVWKPPHMVFYTRTTTLHPADVAANDFKLQELYKYFLMSVFVTIL